MINFVSIGKGEYRISTDSMIKLSGVKHRKFVIEQGIIAVHEYKNP